MRILIHDCLDADLLDLSFDIDAIKTSTLGEIDMKSLEENVYCFHLLSSFYFNVTLAYEAMGADRC